jgi:hypothetical protein
MAWCCFFGLLTLTYFLKLIFPNAIFLKNVQISELRIDNRPFEEKYNENGIFEFQENGFIIDFNNGKQLIKWDEIQTIFGYKLDNFTTDTICTDIFLVNKNNFTITEETRGWFQFLKHLKERFSNIDKTWEIKIATPVFDTKLTLIYDRENRTFEDAKINNYKKE